MADKKGSSSDGVREARDNQGRLSILVELVSGQGMSPVLAASGVRGVDAGGFMLDEEFVPVPMPALEIAGMSMESSGGTYVVRATIEDEAAMAELLLRPDVVNLWKDTVIEPFACPIPPCDCEPNVPKGNMADVANYLGVTDVWAAGYKGAGMVVGVVDGGITALGRPVIDGETAKRIPRVIGGWPTDNWGTRASGWAEHGNMTSTDVLGMAPEAQIYDMRISGSGGSPSTISRALQAFQWAIDKHKVDGTPQILTNSWGIFQETWDSTYAKNPNHPFTKKVLEAISEGIIVLFAAGNCGDTCPDGRCGSDHGPGKSIWGANSLPQVMTVGAVNKDEKFVGYSSQGPGALDPNKPDFCCITHFTGYFNSDSGTSAATPILAGAVALLKQAVPGATQNSLKGSLKATAKDIGPSGFDQHSGQGIVRIKAALDNLKGGVIGIVSKVPQQCPKQSMVVICQPSVTIPCLPSKVIVCKPSLMTLCPKFSVLLECPKFSALPGCPGPVSLACPSFSVAMCTPIRERLPIGFGIQEEELDPIDEALAAWYGSFLTSEEEQD
jgi:subtilisin family serine protease